jgi:hypothetical protein
LILEKEFIRGSEELQVKTALFFEMAAQNESREQKEKDAMR